MLLDTSFIIDLLKGQKGAVQKMKSLEAEAIATNISSPSIFELYVGITLSKKSGAEKRRIIDSLSSWGTLPLDTESAKTAGRIYGQLMTEGMMIDAEDAMIAGIALENGEEVLTRNIKHFERIPGISIVTY
jgi:predicted nucleic acid-binding protein